MTQLQRIQHMEQLLDESTKAIQDYEADCAGNLPQDLKRGVLSQDAVYDLLAENDRLLNHIDIFFNTRSFPAFCETESHP